jgi:hypothetical protein
VCVYNERPNFLKWHPSIRMSEKQAKENLRAIGKISDGLDLLANLWQR